MKYKAFFNDCQCFVNNHRRKEERFSWGPGMKDVYSLYYVISGKGRVIIDGTEYCVYGGQAFMVYPYVTAQLICDEDDPWEYKSIEVKGLEMSQNFGQTAFSKGNPVTPPLPNEIFEKAFDVIEGGNEENYQRCRSNARLLLLFSYFMEYFPLEKSAESSYVKFAREYVDNNYRNSDCCVKKVAQQVKLDRTYLYRLFKQELGISVHEYINKCRISKAEYMLSEKNIPVKDIAFSVGFTDQMYFSKVFRKVNGCSPTEYRRQRRRRCTTAPSS